jgi:mRNA-degrading endonuclease toxin of MazEF toxin-antitoxin module
VLIEAGGTGLRRDSIAMTRQIRTIDRARIRHAIRRARTSDLECIDESLRLHLSLEADG